MRYRNLFPLALGCALSLVAIPCPSGWGATKKTPKSPANPSTPTPGTELQLQLWSGELNVPDPVAVAVDPNGVVYATQTTRRKTADLDIREHPQWIPFDVALEDIEQKRSFLHEVLAPGQMRHPEGDLRDHNNDGSIDWRDLTVHTERIWRLEDTNGDGVADKRTVFADGFNTEVTGIAAGIFWFDGWVYCTIAPDLWRLRDTNGDGVANEREVVAHGFGHHIAYAGHDMHGPRIGPDGRIYWSIGDKGVNVQTKEGKKVAEPHQGCILRCEPDGANFEIFAHGLRNLQEFAFDEHGDIFGVDNDSDKPGEKERVVHVVERSDSGWRCYYQYMKGWSPWMDEEIWQVRHPGQPEFITPPMASGHDGPAGFAYNPGTALSAAWKGWFFANQFPSGQMYAMRFSPSGATFKLAEDKLVASGVMGIGMAWSPDGKLMMADWGGGYPLKGAGAVWSADDPTGTDSTERLETKQLLKDGFAKRGPAELSSYLAHADQRVRIGAQFQLVKSEQFLLLKQTALDPNLPILARIHALWGYGQGLRSGKATLQDAGAILAELKKQKDGEMRAQVAKIIGDATMCTPLGEDLIPLLTDTNVRARFQAAIALGKLKTPVAVEALLKLAATNNDADAYIRHAAVIGLEGCATPDQLAATHNHPSRAVRLVALLALRHQASPAVSNFLKDKDPGIAAEAARAIHDDASIMESLPALAATTDSKSALPEPMLRRAVNAAFRIGDAKNITRVIKFALRPDAPVPVREFALSLVRQWAEPPPLDNVDGRARKLAMRDPAIVANAIQPHLSALMDLKEPSLKTKGIQLLTAYQLRVAPKIAVEAVMAREAPPETRAEALNMLAKQHPESQELSETLTNIFSDPKAAAPLRIGALDAALLKNKDQAVSEALKILDGSGVTEKQHAYGILASAATPEADAAIGQQLDDLLSKKVPAPLQLDLIEAAQARGASTPGIRERLVVFDASRAAVAGTPAAFSECQEGGDASAGKEIALGNMIANCTACHRFDKREGSNVGPPLDKIGSQRDRPYLLEALISPNSKIAPGYGLITATLNKGETVTGALVSADAQKLEIRLADGKTRKIAMSEVKSKTDPISVMPPMSAILNKHQIRDVIAYLASLKGSSSGKTTSKKDKKK